MNLWLTILAAGLITFLIRLSFIVILERWAVPGWFQSALRFVPAAVLSAIILPEVATQNGTIDLSWRNPQLLAGILAVLVAWRTRNVLLTLLVGLLTFLLFSFLLG